MKTPIDHAARAAAARAAAAAAYARPASLASLHAHVEATRRAAYHDDKAAAAAFNATREQRKLLVERMHAAAKIIAKHEKGTGGREWREARFERVFDQIRYGKRLDVAGRFVEAVEKYAETGVLPPVTPRAAPDPAVSQATAAAPAAPEPAPDHRRPRPA